MALYATFKYGDGTKYGSSAPVYSTTKPVAFITKTVPQAVIYNQRPQIEFAEVS